MRCREQGGRSSEVTDRGGTAVGEVEKDREYTMILIHLSIM